MKKIFDLFIKYPVYALVFLMPLFWLPVTNESFGFNKQMLLAVLVGVAFLSWLAKMILFEKKLAFYRSPLDLFVVIFMAMMIFSASFSIDPVSSWLGDYGRYANSAIGFLAMAVLYFVIINNVRRPVDTVSRVAKETSEEGSVKTVGEENVSEKPSEPKAAIKKNSKSARAGGVLRIEKMLDLFVTSSWVIVVLSYFTIYGLVAKIPGLPQVMGKGSFNTINGSLQGLAIFLVIAIAVVVGRLLRLQTKKGKSKLANRRGKIAKLLNVLFVVASLVLMMMIDYKPAWMSLLLVMTLLLVVAFWTRTFKTRVNLLFLPVVILVIGGISGFTNLEGYFNRNILNVYSVPQELSLSYKLSNEITWQTVKEYPVLGSGQGTFSADFLRYKPQSFNDSRFWNVEFNKAPSQVMELAATTGVLGVFSFLAVMVMFLMVGLLAVKKAKREKLTIPDHIYSCLLGWLGAASALLFYQGNTVTLSLFWIFTALAVASWQKNGLVSRKKTVFSFSKYPEVGLIMNVVMLILAFAFVGLVYVGGRFYVADVTYAKAINSQEMSAKDLAKQLEKAVNLNPYRAEYRELLSQAYLSVATQEANKPEDKRDIQLIQNYTSGALTQAKQATLLSPKLPGPWKNLGMIYRESRMLVSGALPFAKDSFKKALEMEPHNPSLYHELCRIGLLNNEKELEEALNSCKRAVELKDNYLDARLQLALVYEKKGELETAAKEMESVLERLRGTSFQRGSSTAAAVAEIYFQLGRLYFNLEQTKKAVKMFEQSVTMMPNYANARYTLAMAYEAVGRADFALKQYEILREMIKDDQQLATQFDQKIEQLKQQVAAQEAQEAQEGEAAQPEVSPGS